MTFSPPNKLSGRFSYLERGEYNTENTPRGRAVYPEHDNFTFRAVEVGKDSSCHQSNRPGPNSGVRRDDPVGR